MKKGIILFLAVLFAIPTFAMAGTQEEIDNAAFKLKQDFPQMTFESVKKTAITGVFEFVAGENVLYYSPESGHLLFGELWNKDGENLTQKTKDAMAAKKIKDLPMGAAVKIGNGPKVVIEVTDPDCPFCRKGSDYLDTKEEEITRYIFFFPLKQIHPMAEAKAKYVLASDDKVKAYKEVMSGKYDSAPLPEFVDNGLMTVHNDVAKKLGVRGTPAYWIDGTAVSGANIPAIEKLLQQ